MKQIILGFAAIVTIFTIHMMVSPSTHQCQWQECPLTLTLKQGSPAWEVLQVHKADPSLTYEECEQIIKQDEQINK